MPHKLIPSDRVEGTSVYDRDGKHIGRIERVMIDKISGQVAYAVLTFGGFLGFGENHFPVPWDALKYQERTEPAPGIGVPPSGGYVLDVTEQQLEQAPYYGPDDDFDWGDRTNEQRIRDIYPTYGWM